MVPSKVEKNVGEERGVQLGRGPFQGVAPRKRTSENELAVAPGAADGVLVDDLLVLSPGRGYLAVDLLCCERARQRCLRWQRREAVTSCGWARAKGTQELAERREVARRTIRPGKAGTVGGGPDETSKCRRARCSRRHELGWVAQSRGRPIVQGSEDSSKQEGKLNELSRTVTDRKTTARSAQADSSAACSRERRTRTRKSAGGLEKGDGADGMERYSPKLAAPPPPLSLGAARALRRRCNNLTCKESPSGPLHPNFSSQSTLCVQPSHPLRRSRSWLATLIRLPSRWPEIGARALRRLERAWRRRTARASVLPPDGSRRFARRAMVFLPSAHRTRCAGARRLAAAPGPSGELARLSGSTTTTTPRPPSIADSAFARARAKGSVFGSPRASRQLRLRTSRSARSLLRLTSAPGQVVRPRRTTRDNPRPGSLPFLLKASCRQRPTSSRPPQHPLLA